VTIVTLRHEAANYGRCSAFFRVAVQLGMLHAVNTRPVKVTRDDLERFVTTMTPDQVAAINRVLHRARLKKKQTPALPAQRKPGRKPGSGFVSQLRRGDETSTTGTGGTSTGHAGLEASGQKKSPAATGLLGGRE